MRRKSGVRIGFGSSDAFRAKFLDLVCRVRLSLEHAVCALCVRTLKHTEFWRG